MYERHWVRDHVEANRDIVTQGVGEGDAKIH